MLIKSSPVSSGLISISKIRSLIIFLLVLSFLSVYFVVSRDSAAYYQVRTKAEKYFQRGIPRKVKYEISREINKFSYGYLHSLKNCELLTLPDGHIALKINPAYNEIECYGIAMRVKQLLDKHGIKADIAEGVDPLNVFTKHYFISLENSSSVFDLTPPYNNPDYNKLSGRYSIEGRTGMVSGSEYTGVLSRGLIDLTNISIPLNYREKDDCLFISTIGINEKQEASDKAMEISYFMTVIPKKAAFPIKYHRLEMAYTLDPYDDNPGLSEGKLTSFGATYFKDKRVSIIKSIDNSEVKPYMKYIEEDVITDFYKKLSAYIKSNTKPLAPQHGV